MKIIVMGPQGSGKTTQARLLAKELNLPHLQTGELYRQMAAQDSPFGKKISQFLSQGQLVPDGDHNQVLNQELSKPEYVNGFVMDGSPRTLTQAQSLPFEPDKIFYLVVSDEENIKRLEKRSRPDDTPELIVERLRLYHQETEPVLDFYRQKGLLIEIDGEREIEVILKEMTERLRNDSN